MRLYGGDFDTGISKGFYTYLEFLQSMKIRHLCEADEILIAEESICFRRSGD